LVKDLDHLAIGVRNIDDAAGRAERGAGGRRGREFKEASWLGLQVAFAQGIRLECLEPIANPADDFLPRFLERHGEGPHHATFKVPDLAALIDELRGLGIEPVKIDLKPEDWKEAFLHPSLGLGTVVQMAQPKGSWSGQPVTPDGSIACAFLGAEIRARMDVAEAVFGRVLEGRRQEISGGGTAYSWPGGGTLAVRPASDGRGGVERFVFRVLHLPEDREPPGRELPLYEGPTPVVRLDSDAPWP
jgi:hypothetical protein